jgi:hypothetical protein
MDRYALTFTVKPGTEEDTARILSSYARPPTAVLPDRPPLLRRTTVLLSGNRVVRLMEVDGDLSTSDFPEGALLARVHDRVTPAQLLPTEGQSSEKRVVLSCPVRPGRGLDAARLLARIRDLTPETPTTLARTTIFAEGDVVVWVVDVAGEPDEGLDGLAALAVGSGCAREVTRFVDAAHDITTRIGFRRFLTDCGMRVLADRRMEVPSPMAA